jgi:hypothetical protein
MYVPGESVDVATFGTGTLVTIGAMVGSLVALKWYQSRTVVETRDPIVFDEVGF